jgi:hypothetical protein
VRIVRRGTSVREGRVALGGDPTSIRLAKLGRARLSLPLGGHRIGQRAQFGGVLEVPEQLVMGAAMTEIAKYLSENILNQMNRL